MAAELEHKVRIYELDEKHNHSETPGPIASDTNVDSDVDMEQRPELPEEPGAVVPNNIPPPPVDLGTLQVNNLPPDIQRLVGMAMKFRDQPISTRKICY